MNGTPGIESQHTDNGKRCDGIHANEFLHLTMLANGHIHTLNVLIKLIMLNSAVFRTLINKTAALEFDRTHTSSFLKLNYNAKMTRINRRA